MSRFTLIIRESEEILIVGLVYCVAVGSLLWMSASPAIG
jgi:hypothetical protein